MTRILRTKALLLLLPLIALFILELGGSFFVSDKNTSGYDTLSAVVTEEPRIDSQAVMVGNQWGEDYSLTLCQSLPTGAWQLLLVIYVLLLLLNFREQYRLKGTVNTYFFELGLTFFFLIEWMTFDTCRAENWFPLALVKLGLITFLLFQVKSLITKHKESH